MKKYLTFAAILGAVAFLSVSYLAQAEDVAAPAAEKAMAPAAEAVPAPAPAPASPELTYAKDRAECELVAVPATEAAASDTAAKAEALKKCLVGKGHSEDEVKTEEEKRAAAPAPATGDAMAPVERK